jgi:hypothetical protein
LIFRAHPSQIDKRYADKRISRQWSVVSCKKEKSDAGYQQKNIENRHPGAIFLTNI